MTDTAESEQEEDLELTVASGLNTQGEPVVRLRIGDVAVDVPCHEAALICRDITNAITDSATFAFAVSVLMKDRWLSRERAVAIVAAAKDRTKAWLPRQD